MKRVRLIAAGVIASITSITSIALMATSTAHAALLPFSPDERAAIVKHGPWPPPLVNDPSNRVSGNIDAGALGQRLFFDSRLSSSRGVACVSCHMPPMLFAEHRKTSVGVEAVDRNAPSIVNARFQRWLGWDGGSDSLWAHSLRPVLDPREHGFTMERMASLVSSDDELACRYRKVFGRSSSSVTAETVAVDAAKALAAFQETLISQRTRFDAFRDAVAAGDDTAAARYPDNAQRGLRIFVGRGNCSTCHVGPLFSNREFADVGIPFFTAPGKVDSGRHRGIVRVKSDPLNQLGAHNDDPSKATGIATRHVELQPKNFGEWKVPGLRNVAHTAPYMHNGSIATLREVVVRYSEIDLERLHADGERILKPLKLGPAEIDDVVAFLESLTSPPPGLMTDLLPTRHARELCVSSQMNRRN